MVKEKRKNKIDKNLYSKFIIASISAECRDEQVIKNSSKSLMKSIIFILLLLLYIYIIGLISFYTIKDLILAIFIPIPIIIYEIIVNYKKSDVCFITFKCEKCGEENISLFCIDEGKYKIDINLKEKYKKSD